MAWGGTALLKSFQTHWKEISRNNWPPREPGIEKEGSFIKRPPGGKREDSHTYKSYIYTYTRPAWGITVVGCGVYGRVCNTIKITLIQRGMGGPYSNGFFGRWGCPHIHIRRYGFCSLVHVRSFSFIYNGSENVQICLQSRWVNVCTVKMYSEEGEKIVFSISPRFNLNYPWPWPKVSCII